MSFAPASADGVAVPVCEELPIDTAVYAAEVGALLIQTGANAVECGADPALVLGVAATPGGVDVAGYIGIGRREFPPGTMQFFRVARNQPFTALYVGALPANTGGEYGVVRDADGFWKVDFGETVAKVVRLVRKLAAVELPIGAAGSGKVVVEFLPAVVVPPLT